MYSVHIKHFVFDNVVRELERVYDKWGEQNHNDYEWMNIILEEIGEISKAINQNKETEIVNECIQSIAMIMMLIQYQTRKVQCLEASETISNQIVQGRLNI